ncbi:hypothetical protein D3C71_794810 [compost metagenome]
MKNLFLILICLSALSISSCSDQRPVLDKIRSQKTPQHLNIGGTRLFIVPPKGFTIAEAFVGLIKNRDCTIQIIDSKGEKIRGAFSAYDDSMFIKQGMKILESKRIRVNEYSGKLIVVPGKFENTETLYLLFGDNSFSVLVTANYETVEKKTREEIYNSLKTIYLDRNFNADISIHSNYFFSDKTSGYKFCEKMAQFDLYTINGDLKALNTEEPVIMVTPLKHLENVELEKVAELNIFGLKQQGAKIVQISEQSNESINGYETLSRKVSFSINGASKTSYQAFVKKNDQVIAIQGIVFDKDLDKLGEIKQFSSSLVIK